MTVRAQPTAARRASLCAARGFTLIEVLIAIGLGVGILLALTLLFAGNSSNQAELERTIRQLESARFSLDTLAEDVMHAGYFSDFNPEGLPIAPSYQLPDPCAVDPGALGWDTTPTAAPILMPVAVQGIPEAAALACLSSRRPGTEAVAVRRAETSASITAAASRADNLYIQISRCGLDVRRVLAARGPAANFTLRRPDCTTINDSIRRLTQRTYYIATCNDCVNDDRIPTLKRVEMVDGALRTASIAEGVENLQVEFGLDTNNDGQPDFYATNGAGLITGVAPNVWQNVVTVRLHLLIRSTQTTPGYSDTRSYQIGPDVALAAPSDGFKRMLVTSTVRLQNVGMRRE